MREADGERTSRVSASVVRSAPQLIVLSDFLQDNRGSDFRRDPRLATSDSGKQFGAEWQKRVAYHPSVQVFLGRLRSADYTTLSAKRREGASAYWKTLMPISTIEPDGPQGLLWRMPQIEEKVRCSCKRRLVV